VTGDDESGVPVSIRLGAVVPPEDPEDWTRPLTWVAALGMLAAPLIALAWFAAAAPAAGGVAPPTLAVAAALGAGAALTGATQQGRARAWTATLGAGLFGALGVVIVGVVLAGERQVGAASPTLQHAMIASALGLLGALLAAGAAAIVARSRAWPTRAGIPSAIAVLAVVSVGLVAR
jgi:hypothetical protein